MRSFLLCFSLFSTALFAQYYPAGGGITAGTSLPATCTVGQVYSLSSGAIGIYVCTATNVWSQVNVQLSGSTTGISCYPGGTDGTIVCVSAADTAGGNIAYIWPSTAGSTNQVLTDNGSATCPAKWPTAPTGVTWPAVCHQLIWSGAGTVTRYADIFDGSTTTLADGSVISWSCGSGAGAQCTASWTPPAGVNHVHVKLWSGGQGGQASTGGTRSDAAGSGGGYAELECATTPGTPVTVAVGQGGPGGTTTGIGANSAIDAGDSSFGACVTVKGAKQYTGSIANGAPGGSLGGAQVWISSAGTGLTTVNTSTSACNALNALRIDQGGCAGNSQSSSGTAGIAGGTAIGGGGGGGSGGYNNATGGTGGTSVLGGAGGNGGGWTSGGGYVACANGTIPAGGGGSAGASTTASDNHAGCNGARGEVRVYY